MISDERTASYAEVDAWPRTCPTTCASDLVVAGEPAKFSWPAA